MPVSDGTHWNLARSRLSSVVLAVGRPQPLAVFLVACCRRWRERVVSNRLWAHGMMSGKPGIESGALPFQRSSLADRRRQAVALMSKAARAKSRETPIAVATSVEE